MLECCSHKLSILQQQGWGKSNVIQQEISASYKVAWLQEEEVQCVSQCPMGCSVSQLWPSRDFDLPERCSVRWMIWCSHILSCVLLG